MDIKKSIEVVDLEMIDYKDALEYQQKLLEENIHQKKIGSHDTKHYLLLCQHPPVYTLGKNGNIDHLLFSEEERLQKNIDFHYTNRGGDITFHGPGQMVAYPILDLEKIETDIGKYLRGLEEVIIRLLSTYSIKGDRSPKETGVWIDPDIPEKARKICAIGIRLSRWVSMHGLALNVNTDLSYFDGIVPCGITNKKVSSIQQELNTDTKIKDIQHIFVDEFCKWFHLTPSNNTYTK